MPIFDFRCACGRRFERLIARDASAPPCPDCAGPTRKVPAGPSLLGRRSGSAAPPVTTPRGDGRAVPIPWQGVVRGGPEKLKREITFRQQLEAKAREGIHVPGGPARQSSDAGPGPTPESVQHAERPRPGSGTATGPSS